MTNGTIIIYDDEGVIIHVMGESKGDVPSHRKPVGIKYLEFGYGELDNVFLIRVDVSVTPHKLITDKVETKPSYEELENQLILNENNNVEGGIF